ncbi:MAG TPA: hypothetical protein GXZ89_06740 [Fastidiosipila sp.]|nr:hypothetical protein [Fastidiosipila sp.]
MKKSILFFTLFLSIFFIAAPISAITLPKVLEEEDVEIIELELGDFTFKLPSNWVVESADIEEMDDLEDTDFYTDENEELYAFRIDSLLDDNSGYLYAGYFPDMLYGTESDEEINSVLETFITSLEDDDFHVIDPEFIQLGVNASVLCIGEMLVDDDVYYFDLITILPSTGDLYFFTLQRESEDESDPDYELLFEQIEMFGASDEDEIVTTESDSQERITTGMRNAVSTAESYLRYTSFSKLGLVGQLEYEGYTNEEAVYAVNNVDVDWKEQALDSAKRYLDYSAFSYKGLIGQLEYEKYTSEESKYGADNCGADWMEQAVKAANRYLDVMSFSKRGLIDQLKYDGFTDAEARYGVENADADW